jgi:hypothetical protein
MASISIEGAVLGAAKVSVAEVFDWDDMVKRRKMNGERN